MTEGVQIALIVGVPVFITALGGVIVSIHTAFRTAEIHTATNGTLSTMVANDKVQVERMAGLEKQIAMLLEDKAGSAKIAETLAAAKAINGTPHVDANTKAIVENTEATDVNSDVRAVKPKKRG